MELRPLGAMPRHLAFNRFVRGGYRRHPMDAAGCLASALRLHNETGNIYSHLLPLVGALWLCGQPWPGERASYYLMMLLILGVFSGSVLYHTFMPQGSVRAGMGPGLSWGQEREYNLWLMLDYCGIWLLLTGIPQLVVIRWGFGPGCPSARWVLHLSYGISSLGSLLVLAYPPLVHGRPGSAKHRLGALAIQFVARLPVYAARGWMECGQRGALGYYLAMEGLSAVGGVVNAARAPERWLPGRLDLGPNSHQIMHVCAAAAIGLMWLGTRIDYEHRPAG